MYLDKKENRWATKVGCDKGDNKEDTVLKLCNQEKKKKLCLVWNILLHCCTFIVLVREFQCCRVCL